MIDEIKWLCAFTKYTTQKVITKLHISMLICWYYRHLVLLTLNATNLTWKPSGNCIFRHLGRWVFHIFPRFHLIMGVTHQYFSKIPPEHGGDPNVFYNFPGCYNIQFKPYETSKMELFLAKNTYWLETVAEWCYKELCLK